MIKGLKGERGAEIMRAMRDRGYREEEVWNRAA